MILDNYITKMGVHRKERKVSHWLRNIFTLRTFQEVNPSEIYIGQAHLSQKCGLICSLYSSAGVERAS